MVKSGNVTRPKSGIGSSALQNDRPLSQKIEQDFFLCVTCKQRFTPLIGRDRAPPRTLPNTSGIRAEGIAHGTLLASERGAE